MAGQGVLVENVGGGRARAGSSSAKLLAERSTEHLRGESCLLWFFSVRSLGRLIFLLRGQDVPCRVKGFSGKHSLKGHFLTPKTGHRSSGLYIFYSLSFKSFCSGHV